MDVAITLADLPSLGLASLICLHQRKVVRSSQRPRERRLQREPAAAAAARQAWSCSLDSNSSQATPQKPAAHRTVLSIACASVSVKKNRLSCLLEPVCAGSWRAGPPLGQPAATAPLVRVLCSRQATVVASESRSPPAAAGSRSGRERASSGQLGSGLVAPRPPPAQTRSCC